MKRARIIGIAATATVATLLSTSAVRAADYTWNTLGGGTQAWDTPANWTPSGSPSTSGDTGNLEVILIGDLSVDLPVAGVTMGNLSLGGTGAAVTTDIGNANATGGILTLANDSATSSDKVTIDSGGVAGSTNIISAPIRLTGATLGDPQFEVTGTNTLTLSGGLTSFGTNTALNSIERTLINSITGGELHITGGIFLSDAADTQGAPTVGRRLLLKGAGTTIIDGTINDGPLPHAGVAGSSGPLNFGTTSSSDPVGTVIINSDNSTTFTGEMVQNRAVLVLGSDGALGTGRLRQGNPSNRFGFDIQSTDDSRTIANEIRVAQHMTISGDHSINFSGLIAQGNGRSMINILPAGKTLTLSGTVDTANSSDNRFFIFDGSGQTVVSAAIHDTIAPNTAQGSIDKRGTGTTLVNGTASDYTGLTMASGGLLQLATSQAYGAGSTTGGSFGMVANPGGAIALQTGSLDLNFLNLFQASFDYMKTGNDIFSFGGLALTNVDAASNVDFTSGPLAQTHLANLSIAADGNINYTGTITPNPAVGYRIGGGGTLTLANANALTGANNVTVTNGGVVAVPNLNNYTGTTTVRAEYITTNTQRAITKDSGQPGVFFESTTLQAAHLGNGGSPSSIGSSTSDAANLVLQGGALEYTGAGESTDRQFTIGTYGGELDASGTGAITFTNTAPAAMADAAARTGDVNSAVNRNQIQNVGDVSDVVIGMPISGTGIAPGATIAAILDQHTLQMSANAVTTQVGTTVTFGAVPRTFTLGGSSTATNTLAAGLNDSAVGSVLSVAKTGAGTWNLTGALGYTGTTTVSAGTLALATNLTTSTGINVSGGSLQLAPGGGNNRVIVAPTPTISGTGVIDLTDNKMIVTTAAATGTWTGAAYTGITGLVASGRNGGTWNGSGITSSSATGNLTSLGVAKVGDFKGITDTDTATFGGQTVHGSDTVVMYTYGGDANLDGKINIDDYGRIDGNVGLSGTVFGWYNGDFNYDGKINIDDYGIIDGNIGIQGAPIPNIAQSLAGAAQLGGVTAVPEPASLGLLALAGAGLLRRRRRR